MPCAHEQGGGATMVPQPRCHLFEILQSKKIKNLQPLNVQPHQLGADHATYIAGAWQRRRLPA
jgi:hypothetical protein